MNMQETVANTKQRITSIKRASNVIKKHTQEVVNNFLSLNNMRQLDQIPYLATRMTQVMTKTEAKAFQHFVSAHFPLKWEDDNGIFNSIPIKVKAHKAKCEEARKVFMEEYDNNYWLWVGTNVKVEKKEVDWLARVDSAIASATNPDKGGVELDDLLAHIIEKEGISNEQLMALIKPKNEPLVLEHAA